MTLYYSQREIRNLRVDVETKVLNDLNEKIHGMGDMMIQNLQLIRILDRDFSERTPEMAFAYYILYMCAHAFHMRQRKILNDNEWDGWLRWMRSSFEQGEIREYWKNKIDRNRWFDPAFQEFIDKEVVPYAAKKQ